MKLVIDGKKAYNPLVFWKFVADARTKLRGLQNTRKITLGINTSINALLDNLVRSSDVISSSSRMSSNTGREQPSAVRVPTGAPAPGAGGNNPAAVLSGSSRPVERAIVMQSASGRGGGSTNPTSAASAASGSSRPPVEPAVQNSMMRRRGPTIAALTRTMPANSTGSPQVGAHMVLGGRDSRASSVNVDAILANIEREGHTAPQPCVATQGQIDAIGNAVNAIANLYAAASGRQLVIEFADTAATAAIGGRHDSFNFQGGGARKSRRHSGLRRRKTQRRK